MRAGDDGSHSSVRRRARRALGVAALVAAMASAGAAAARGATAPDFSASSTAGDTLRLSQFRGRPVVVEFWATWCPPCHAQLERLAALERQVPEVVVLAVNVDSRRDKVRQFLRRVEAPRHVLLDPNGRIAVRYGAQGMPWTVLVDPSGNTVLARGGGGAAGFSEIAAAVRRLATRTHAADSRSAGGAGR